MVWKMFRDASLLTNVNESPWRIVGSGVPLFRSPREDRNPLMSTAPGELIELAARAAQEYELLVAVGGDGTVNEVVTQLSTLLEADYVVIGGGNARKLKRLPKNARLGSNDFAFLGGFRVWHHAAAPPAAAKAHRRSITVP